MGIDASSSAVLLALGISLLAGLATGLGGLVVVLKRAPRSGVPCFRVGLFLPVS